MSETPSPEFDTGRVRQLQRFQDLMPFRVHNLLLAASLYDSFILAEDGQVSELMLGEFLDLNLHHTPGLARVSTGEEVLAQLRGGRPVSLVVASLHLSDMNAAELARRVREEDPSVPVVALAFSNRELKEFTQKSDLADVDRVFLWQGDVRILLAIVKYVEDRRNVAHDHDTVGVQSILVIEDSVRFYSSFLPLIYTELVKQSHSVLSEGVNLSQKVLRMRARPKILLCDTYEQAWDDYTAYKDAILGIISDIEFPRNGQLFAEAGVEFARKVRQDRPDIPIMLQSSLPRNRSLAKAVGADFLLKGSPVLLNDLRRFMTKSFSFGDFVFRTREGAEVARAADLRTLERLLQTVPAESLAYHGERNDFSNWLKARTEFALANRLRPRKVSEYATLEDLRSNLIASIREYRQERDRGTVADFDREVFDASGTLYRIGGGSLGGKARGLAFANFLLNTCSVPERFPGVRVSVPPSVVLGTGVFDRFLEENDLRDFAIGVLDDRELWRRFREARLPEDVREDLAAFLAQVRYPLAVRSSSLLEDSAHQPFAGIYDTYMLPNNDQYLGNRLDRLITAVKRVFASTFTRRAKSYLESGPYRLEEEKMGVILQKLVGGVHGNRIYPDISGVVRSHNFYPTGPMSFSDGIASVALGLGKTVVEGEACMRFCPRYPRHLMQFSTVDDVLRNSQREFHALELDAPEGEDLELTVRRLGLETAEADGVLAALGSTYSTENHAVYDGLSRAGVRLVSFAPILKHQVFPLADLLVLLLELGAWGASSDVEIEFAVNLSTPQGQPKEFGFLQLRPQAAVGSVEQVDLSRQDPAAVICESPSVMGNGRVELRDAVVVDYDRFDRGRSREAAREVERFNARLVQQGRPFLLVGVGRWGSGDPHLGIPVTWEQISGARVIVESGFRDFIVTPSQGSHFFHNLTSLNIGYFTVNPQVGDGRVEWDWFRRQPAVEEGAYFRMLRFDRPMTVLMSGKTQQGLILRPQGSE